MTTTDLSVQLAPDNKQGLLLANPVIAASGTFGYGTEYADVIDTRQLGAIVSKGITLKPQSGNPQPRLAETPCGMLNSIGLENIGIEAVIREKASLWSQWQVPVIINIAGESIEEYAQLAELLDGIDGISGIEVNISCPNVENGGMEFGVNTKTVSSVTLAVRSKTSLPLIVKLTPNITDITEIARAAAEAGADCLTVANTYKGMAIDTQKRRPILGNKSGGLSGPAVRPLSLYLVYKVFLAVNIPIIGCGGIMTANDALEFIMAGAHAVQVGTATFANPSAMLDIVEGIGQFIRMENLPYQKLIGAAHDQ